MRMGEDAFAYEEYKQDGSDYDDIYVDYEYVQDEVDYEDPYSYYEEIDQYPDEDLLVPIDKVIVDTREDIIKLDEVRVGENKVEENENEEIQSIDELIA